MINTPGLGRWLRIRSKVLAFKDLERGSELHQTLLDGGVDSALLDKYTKEPFPRQRKTTSSHWPPSSWKVVSRLLGSGGVLAGGAALRMWRNDPPVRDWDVFFSSFPMFVQASLETRNYPSIDICLFETIPVEGFDLEASKVMFDGSSFNVSSSAQHAFDTGVSDIDMSSIIHPVATLRRVCKYANNWGLRFSRNQIASLVSVYGVHDQELIRAAFAFSVNP